MRYLLGILATLGLIILILVLLFRGGGSAPEVKSLNVVDYANSNSVAHYTLASQIVADPDHYEVRIDVDAEDVTFSLIRGYEGNVIDRKTYTNNQEAYTTFLKSLQLLNFTKGNSDKALEDVRGRCPLGQRSTYSFTDDSKVLMHFWSTSCGQATFEGSINTVSTLFQRQVPDYAKLVTNTQIGSF